MRKLLAGLALGALSSVAIANGALAETKIVYANYLVLKHPTNTVLDKFFADVEAATNGSVTFERHYASSLLGPKDIPAGVRDGIADGGYFVGVYVPSEMPVDNYLGDFSMLNDDAVLWTGVNNELILLECESCRKEYEDGFNTKFIATYALTDYLLQCKEEYRTLDDIRGKKIRGFAGWSEMIKEMGAIPINVSANEMYEALERGTIDCATHSITSQRSRSLGEVAHYVILDSLGGFMGGSTFNIRLDKWDELTREEREVILRHAPQIAAGGAYGYLQLDKEVRKEYEAKGNKFYHAEPDLANFIKEFRESYIPRAIEKGRERGVKNPEEIAEKILALRDKWTKLLEEHGRDRETFERLLWDEVYSKVSLD